MNNKGVPTFELPLRLVVLDPPADVDFGIQSGRGADYDTLYVQRRSAGDLRFDLALTVVGGAKNGAPDFRGPLVQGPARRRFIYVDVGTYAGQQGTPWSRRMKVPLDGITWPAIDKARKSGGRLTARVAGTGRDGGPSCGTVELLDGWRVTDRDQ